MTPDQARGLVAALCAAVGAVAVWSYLIAPFLRGTLRTMPQINRNKDRGRSTPSRGDYVNRPMDRAEAIDATLDLARILPKGTPVFIRPAGNGYDITFPVELADGLAATARPAAITRPASPARPRRTAITD